MLQASAKLCFMARIIPTVAFSGKYHKNETTCCFQQTVHDPFKSIGSRRNHVDVARWHRFVGVTTGCEGIGRCLFGVNTWLCVI